MRFLIRNSALLAVTGFAAVLLAGCAGTVPISYAPSSTLTATGAVTVGPFDYLPAEIGRVSPNQISNTALGDIHLDKKIAAYYQTAVFDELRFVGIKTANQNRQLTGTVKKFLADDFGFSVDWTLIVDYAVKNPETGKLLYETEKTVKQNSSKFANPMGAVNEVIRKNIEKLIKDPKFLHAIGGRLISTGPQSGT